MTNDNRAENIVELGEFAPLGQRTILGKELEANGVSNETIKAAKEQGTLYDLLTTKLAAYGEAGKAASETQTAAIERLHTAWSSLLGELTKPFAQDVTDGLNAISSSLDDTQKKANDFSWKKFAAGTGDVAHSLVDVGKILGSVFSPSSDQENADYYKKNRINVSDHSFSEGVNDIFSGWSQLDRINEETKATDEQTDKLSQDYYAKRRKLKKDGNPSANPDSYQTPGAIPEFSGFKALDSLAAQEKEAALPPSEKIGILKRHRQENVDYLADPSRSSEEVSGAQKKVLEFDKQIAELEKQIAAEKKKVSDDASAKSQDDQKKAAKRVELDLELAIKEAKVSGNDKLKDSLNWQREYNRLLKERQENNDPDAYGKAIRGANVAVDQSPIDKARDLEAQARSAFPVSNMAKMGMAMGESTQAAGHVSILRQMLTKMEKHLTKDDVLGIIRGETLKVEEQKGGYQ